MCDILEEQTIPQVDALIAPTLDPQMLSHISYQVKNFVQERNKEILVTGPLCFFHDILKNNIPVHTNDIKRLWG